MRAWVIHLATVRPGLVFLLVAGLTVLLGTQIPRINIDTDPENMLSADQSDRVFHNEIEARFTLHDAIVVGVVNDTHPNGVFNVESLTALHQLSNEILGLEGVVVPDLMSLPQSDNITQTSDGMLRFEWMMKDAPIGQSQALEIQAKVARLPLLHNTLVSGDGQAAAIYVPITSKDMSYRLSGEIAQLTEKFTGSTEFHITGLPVAEDTFGHEMFVQMGISAPLAGVMIFLLMWYFFRSARLVVAPMIVAMATVIITMGLLIGLGFTVHIMSSMIPIFLMPIAVVDSVHIMSEFVDRYDPSQDRRAVIEEVVGHLFTPMLFTSLTSSVGFLSLLITPIPPVQVFGCFVALGILLAFILTVLFIPAYVVRMSPQSLAKLGRLKDQGALDTPLARWVRRLGGFAYRRGKMVTALAALGIAFSIAGIMTIQINDNPVRWFKTDHRIRVADQVLNDHFAGTYDAFLVLEYKDDNALAAFRGEASPLLEKVAATGYSIATLKALVDRSASEGYFGPLISAIDDATFEADEAAEHSLVRLLDLAEQAMVESKYFQRPDALRRITTLQQALMASGGVGKTNALPDVVKVVNRELRGGKDVDYQIPATVPAVAQTLLQYQSSHRPQDLWHMVTPDFTSTAIWLQLKSGDNQDMTAVKQFMDTYLDENPLPRGVAARWAGKTYINVVWQGAMVAGMMKSLLGAFVIVFFMMTALFRSWRLGLLAMVPLSVTIVGVYGIIGWVGKDYDMPIAVLSSLTLGLSVDFAIHFLQRTRALYRQLGSFQAAMTQVFEEPGRAIARNAVVIALGFTPLFVAPLVPYITVGAFMASIMAISGLATLVLLPALMSWKPDWWFAEKTKHSGLSSPAEAKP